MLQLRHVPLVLHAVGRWFVTTAAGRRLGAGALGAGVVAWSLLGGGQSTRSGTWSGLPNTYAPRDGTLVLEGDPGKSATCTVRGRTGSASGNGWVFRGDAAVKETSCAGKIAKNGRVAATLKLRMEWNGRVKGIGGDWEDVAGKADCEGVLDGTLGSGGVWNATCRGNSADWTTAIQWKLDGS